MNNGGEMMAVCLEMIAQGTADIPHWAAPTKEDSNSDYESCGYTIPQSWTTPTNCEFFSNADLYVVLYFIWLRT